MKKQMKWLSGVAIGCLGFTLLGLGCLKTPTNASAETIGGVDVSSFTMQYGAAVRKMDDGIRFTAQLDASAYTALMATRSETVTVEYGMLITTSKYANDYDINSANVFGNNAVYYWDENDKTETRKYPIANLTSNRMGKSATAGENDPYLLYGSIVDAIPDDATVEERRIYMQGKYVACAYIKYVDENGNASYAFADYAKDVAVDDIKNDDNMPNNTRSMFQVALNRIASGDSSSDGLLTNYVLPVLPSECEIETYMDAHTGNIIQLGDTISLDKYSGSLTNATILEALRKDGYTGQKASFSVVDGTTTIKCVLQPNDVVVSAQNTTETISIPGANYFYVTNSSTYFTNVGHFPAVYRNETGAEWTVCKDIVGSNIPDGKAPDGGMVAILDSAGRLIEGRDGITNKLVNASSPVRVTAEQYLDFTYNGNSYDVYEQYEWGITIPAGGYAIVIPGGDAYKLDRQFVQTYVMPEYDTPVSLTLRDAQNSETQYTNKAKVTGNSEVVINAGTFSTEQVKQRLFSGMKIVNDNGTFTAKDDITDYHVSFGSIVNKSTGEEVELDDVVTSIATVTDFTVTMQALYKNATTGASDSVTITRTLKVLPSTSSEHDVRLYIKDRAPNTGEVYLAPSGGFLATGSVYIDNASTLSNAYNSDVLNPTVSGTTYHNQFVIFSYDYLKTGAGSAYTGSNSDTYGVALLVNSTGRIMEVFDGYSGKYFGSKGSTCTPTGYVSEAITAFKAGSYSGGYLIIAPRQVTANQATEPRGSFTFLYANRTVGRYIECSKLFFTYNDAYTSGDAQGIDSFSLGWDYFN